jgi:IPT/TIG domain
MYEQTDPDLFEGGPVVAEGEAPAPEVAIEPAVTAADTVNVTVTTLGGTSATSAAHKYTYIPAPTVTALDVTSGPGAGGNTVVITGINLSGATAVKFGAVSADFTVDSATQITVTVPAAVEPAAEAEAPTESEAEVEAEVPEAAAAEDKPAEEAGAEG